MTVTSPQVKKLLLGLTAGGIGFVVAVALWIPGWLDTWEGKTWDWRVNLLAAPGPATDRIRLILLDQNVLAPSAAIVVRASVTRAFWMASIPCLSWMCPISWARTAARASSFRQQRKRPRVTKTRPLGVAKALISSEFRTRKW